MGSVVLVAGGARSGKSEVAERIAVERGPKVTYLATARRFGREMSARIALHEERRSGDWMTIESPYELLPHLDSLGGTKVLMIECLYVWSSNCLLRLGDPKAEDWAARVVALEKQLVTEVEQLVAGARERDIHLILVTSEVGLGHVPETPRPRAFRDLLGRVNRAAAGAADDFYLVFAGIPVELKKLAAAFGAPPV